MPSFRKMERLRPVSLKLRVNIRIPAMDAAKSQIGALPGAAFEQDETSRDQEGAS